MVRILYRYMLSTVYAAPVWLCPASWFYPLSGGLLPAAILIIPHHSANVEFFDFFSSFLIYGYTGMGTKMFYDSISSSMDYSNRMTGLMGYAPQTK